MHVHTIVVVLPTIMYYCLSVFLLLLFKAHGLVIHVSGFFADNHMLKPTQINYPTPLEESFTGNQPMCRLEVIITGFPQKVCG